MPPGLWSQSELMQLAGHNLPRVRRWACERLESLYGKAGQEVLERLLKDKDDEVLLEALNFLESHPDEKFTDLVLKAYETKTGAVAGRCALMLGKLKDERLIAAYKKKTKTNDGDEKIWLIVSLGKLGTASARNILRDLLPEIKEDTDPFLIDVLIGALLKAKEDMAVPLDAYARLYRERGMEILYPFAAVCGSWYHLEDLKEEEEKKFLRKGLPPVVRECLNYLKDRNYPSLAGALQQAFSQRDYRRVMERAWQWAEESVEENKSKGAGFKEEDSLRGELPPWINYEVLRAFKNYLEKGPEDSFKNMALAALTVLPKFIELKSLWSLKGEEVDPQNLFPLLFEDRDTHPVDNELIGRIMSLYEPQVILNHSLQQLKDHPDSYGTERAVRLLGELKDPAAVPSLLDLLKKEKTSDLQEECIQAMVQIGPPLVDYLEKDFTRLNDDQLVEVLFAFRDIPEEKTVDFLRKKYKKCCLNKEEGVQPEKTSATPKELELRDQLLSFSGNERYKKDFAKAYSLYWRKPFREPLVLREKEDADFPFFLDWFIHDFKRENGLTLIEEFFQSKKERLSPEERSLLQFEIPSHLSLYEVLEVTPEVGLRVKDLFTGEDLNTLEVRGSRTLAKWDIIFARVIKMGPVNKFSGVITLISRRGQRGPSLFPQSSVGKIQRRNWEGGVVGFCQNKSGAHPSPD